MTKRFKFDSLSTSYVNLGALIRYLRENGFTGRLHVLLDQYETDVFLNGSEALSVCEKDQAANRKSQVKAAMRRLLVRAREPGGVITVYESETETNVDVLEAGSVIAAEKSAIDDHSQPVNEPPVPRLIAISNDIINAVERAVESAGISFASQFHSARIEIGDDYPFLDPTAGGFEYENAIVNLQARPKPVTYANAVSEALKRVVNSVAKQKGEAGFRELVAVELAVAARRQTHGLQEFEPLLNRIAGTKVL
jgi:hypothetical protein